MNHMKRKSIAVGIAVMFLASAMVYALPGVDSLKGLYGRLTGDWKSVNKGKAKAQIAKYFVVHPLFRLAFLTWAWKWTRSDGESFAENFYTVILANPSFNTESSNYNPVLASTTGYIIRLVLPLYVLAIISAAFYAMFISGSPKGKAKAKGWFRKLILSMVLFSLSPTIMEIFMGVSYGLTKALMDSCDLDLVEQVFKKGIWGSFWILVKLGMTDLELAIPYWTSLYVMAWLPYMVISLRYILLSMLFMVVPLGIAFYSLPVVKGIGRHILDFSLVWLFMQVFFGVGIMAIAHSTSFYFIVESEQTARLTGIPIPLVDRVMEYVMTTFSTAEIMSVSALAYTLGVAAHAMLIALPFMIARLLEKLLP